MPAKQLIFEDAARQKILRGVELLSRAVKATLGPKGRNVVIDKKFGSPTVTKDGVTVAKEIELPDPYENMGAQMVKEVASKTSDAAGDGTTTATLLAESIYREGLKNVTAGANQGTYNLVSLTSPLITGGTPSVPSVRFTDGTDLILDNAVNVSSDPYLTDNGLVFANDHLVGFNLWGNSPGSYSLFDVSGPPDAHVYFQDNGIAPIAPVPEPTTAGCFLLGLGALVCCQRFIKNRRSQ